MTDHDDRRPPVTDEDDWFATPALEPADLPGEVAWQDEPESPPSRADGLGRRQAMVVLAVIVAVALGAGGILLARSIGGSDGTSGTVATGDSTVQVTTAPVASTPTTTTPAPTAPSTTPTPSAVAVPTDAVLRAGSSGTSVTALQQALTSLGFAPGAADGNFGTATTTAVIAFQKANGLTEDGVAGAQTIAAINVAAASG